MEHWVSENRPVECCKGNKRNALKTTAGVLVQERDDCGTAGVGEGPDCISWYRLLQLPSLSEREPFARANDVQCHAARLARVTGVLENRGMVFQILPTQTNQLCAAGSLLGAHCCTLPL